MELEQRVGGYQAAAMVQEEYQQVYHHIARLVHASRQEIALVESATVAWTRLFYSMVHYQDQRKNSSSSTVTSAAAWNNKKVILVSQVEYAANVVACCHWIQQPNKQHDWTVLCIPSQIIDPNNNTGIVDVTILQDMLEGRFVLSDDHQTTTLDPSCIAVVCITHIPTNSGVINPVEAIGQVIANYNHQHRQQEQQEQRQDTSTLPQIFYLVDACQSVGQMPIDVKKMQCHGLTATGRKYLRGPRGTGFLYVSQEIVSSLVPHQVDHASARVVMMMNSDHPSSSSLLHHMPVEQVMDYTYAPGAARFEFWESNVANRLGLGRAIQYAMDEIGIESIQRTIHGLSKVLQDKLQSLSPGRLTVHHPSVLNDDDNNEDCGCCGIVTFWVQDMPASTIQQALLQCSPSVVPSVSPTTSTPLDSACLQIPDLVRVSLSYTNTLQEIDEFCQQLALIMMMEEEAT
jgi:selenocysteine lyase/cysteine desulfurase